MPSTKPKPCRSKKAAKCNFPQVRSLDPNQAGRDILEDIMEGGREGWYFSPPRNYPSSIFSSPQVRNRDPDQRGRDIPKEIMVEGQGSKDSSPPGGHRSSRPTQQQYRDRQPYVRRPQQYQDHRTYEPRPGPEGRHPHYPEQYPSSRGAERRVRNLDPDQLGREIPKETMAEGQGSRYSSPPGGHRSSRPTQQQYRDRQPYVRRPQQFQDHRTYEPRPGPEGRHPDYPEQRGYSGEKRMVRDRYPDQRGRDIPEETMAEGRGSRYSSSPGPHRSSNLSPEQVRNRDPDQRGRDIPKEIMVEGQGSKDSSPPGGHRSSRPTQQQYRDRQPYVRRPQQYQDHRTYEPRPGPEGRHPHYPEQYPSSRGAERRVRNLDPDQLGREIPKETMAEGQGSRYSSPPGGHRSSRPTQQQYRDRPPYVQRPQQFQDHRTYEPRPGPEGRHPDYPEQRGYSGEKRMVRDRYPDQRGRDIPEEIMAEGRGSRYSSSPGPHRSSNLSPEQYHHRRPYVRPPQQYYEHRTYEPRPGPEGRHPDCPEQRGYSGAKRMVRDRDPDQRGRDIPEETMAEGRGSRYSSPPGGHRSSPPTPRQNSKRPGKQTPKAVGPTTQPIVVNKKGATDTKPGPDVVPKLQPAAERSPSPGLVPPDVQPKKSGNACKPVVTRVSLPAEPEVDITQDLFKKVSSILNWQKPQKFLQLVKQVKDSPIATEEQLQGVVDLVFDQAMNETCLLVTYAKMCSCLATLTVPCTDKPQDTVNFRKLLISRCHMEFQKEKVEDVVKDFSQRRYIGNIKFIGELYKVKMLNDFIVYDCLDKLLMNQDELALECLCVLLTTISKDLELDETKMDHYFNSMEDIVTEGKTSPRIRYMLQDTIDLILHNLVPQKVKQDPEPVQQKEATKEEQEEPRNLQQQVLSEETRTQPDDEPKLQPVGERSPSPGLVQPEAPVETPEAPKALNGLAERGTELETVAHEPSLVPSAALQPQASSPAQVPTPPPNQDSEARITLESQSSSGKKARKRRKRNNKPLITETPSPSSAVNKDQPEQELSSSGSQPDEALKLQPVGERSPSPGLVQPEAPVETPEAQPTPPTSGPELPRPASLSPQFNLPPPRASERPSDRESESSDLSSAEKTIVRKSPSMVEKLLQFNDLKKLQCLHSDASSSEATQSEGSWSPWELQNQMMGLMLEDLTRDKDIFNCVKKKQERPEKSSSPYLRELMAAVCQAAVKENTTCPVHAALLQKGLPVELESRHSEREQQTKALKDLQELIVTLDKPPNLLRMFFKCMSDPAEQLGHGVALKTVTAFFSWLREVKSLDN